jgi:hypothetical protein
MRVQINTYLQVNRWLSFLFFPTEMIPQEPSEVALESYRSGAEELKLGMTLLGLVFSSMYALLSIQKAGENLNLIAASMESPSRKRTPTINAFRGTLAP